MLECRMTGDALYLKGGLRIQHMDELRACLNQALAHPGPLDVDLSEVDDTDMAGLQLLTAFLITRGSNQAVRLRDVAPPLQKALLLAGLHEHLADFMD